MELNKDTLWELFKTFAGFKENSESQQDSIPSQKPETLVKQNKFDEEKMQVIEVLYCPPEEDDLHGERMSDLEIRKMVDNFNENITNISGNLGHMKNTDKFAPIKAWVNEVDCYIGDELVVEGTPLVKIQFNDPELYQARKDGVLKGLSIGAMGVKVKKD
ncbi:hypothetical protein ECO340P2_00139 [Escherichia phage ECO340P2]|uniref:Phage-like element PBSX protein XkdF domain-containing protein n=1 Tax=Escherichia phage anhysbys TaxID=2696383 RepID=A0A6B9XB51_9CAUD|nr:DNA methyltransferase [Escherichia phage anhysbys]WAX14404.1 hypothetical protein ECO340P1_00135 [Escherichia phage ECO340P1]WAX14681.1 hypothetical protein ECO340P2_00139 [Escherichia phage ECO340P2]WPK30709.1 DNA methyltransferase [Escherichia phage ETEC-TG]HCJ8179808.1 hypothetical protein [Escherichia coli]QHR76137.1 hypothetical protein anhysbys_241 [Escherichia phage anhysbys]